MASPRENLEKAAKAADKDLKSLSKLIGHSHAYLQQWVRYGKPKSGLREVERAKLAEVLGIPEADLMEPAEAEALSRARPAGKLSLDDEERAQGEEKIKQDLNSLARQLRVDIREFATEAEARKALSTELEAQRAAARATALEALRRQRLDAAPSAGPPAAIPAAPIPEFPGMPLDVPILGTVRGFDQGRGDFRFSGEALGWAPRPPSLRGIAGVVCFYMLGSSMAPWRREGDLVYVQPGRPARPDEYIVVELKPTEDGKAPEVLVKRLVAKSTDGTLVLEQFSPARRFNITGNKVLRLLRVVDWPELLRFA